MWKTPVTDEHLWTAANYYAILAKGPPESRYILAVIAITGGITILWSLRDGQAGNIMFDGGSICEPCFLPTRLGPHSVQFCLALRTRCISILCFPVCVSLLVPLSILTRFLGVLEKFSALPAHALRDPFPRALRHPTLELASTNLICSVALTGVLALQAGRFWAESPDEDDEDQVLEEFELDGTRPPTMDPQNEKLQHS